MLARNFKAVILDLDEVVAQTVDQHVRAWKIAFDEYLDQDKKPGIDLKRDFSKYIEKNPKEEAVKIFLDLKNIALPEGKQDSDKANTINGLINKGKKVFLDLIGREGINTFQDTITQIKRWKSRGLKIAIISGEQNAGDLLRLVGVEGLIDLILDGKAITNIHLNTKPSPEAYSYICKQLQVSPEETVLIENTADGIKAGREANFGLVVGMVRDNKPKRELLQNGADIVVGNMEELRTIGLKKSFNYEI
jgi:beta-phosphoglucomutase-like phosphatase (HAD superfamily)